MKFKARVIDPIGWGAAIGAGLLATLALLPQARGEFVFENEVDQGPVEIRNDAAHDVRSEDRRVLRQALTSSEKARATREAEAVRTPQMRAVAQPTLQIPPPAPPVVQVPAAQTVIVGEAALSGGSLSASVEPAAAPVENLSKTELMRRERVREELRNEDAIQERLEALRLRDEQRRGGQILKSEGALPTEQLAPVQAAGMAPLQDEVVVSPITNHPGETVPAPVNPALQQTAVVPAQSVAAAPEVDAEDSEDQTKFYLRPLAGLSEMKVDGAFAVKPHYTAGATVGIVSSDNLAFELSYAYSDYGIQMNSSNPYVAQLQALNTWQGFQSTETQALKKNTFDAGVKIALLNANSRIRPFLSGGAGYQKQYVNYSNGYIQSLEQMGLQSMTRDYESSGFLGYVATGFDVRVSKSLSLGGEFKYHGVLSSRENEQLNFNGLYSNPYWFGALDQDKRAAGASLSESAFYSITGTATFTF